MSQPLYIECDNGTWIIHRKPAGEITADEQAILRKTLADDPGDISVNIRGRVFELLRLKDFSGAQAGPEALEPAPLTGPACDVRKPPGVRPPREGAACLENEIYATREAANCLLDRVLAHLQQKKDPDLSNPVTAQKRKLLIQSLIVDLQGTVEALQVFLKSLRRDA